MPHPDADDPSEVELSEEVESGSTPSEPTPLPTDSSADLRYAGEAPDVDPYEFNPEAAPNRDLSGFQDDAGADASYGFEAASETARFSSKEFQEVEEELAEDANLNDSGEFTAAAAGQGVDEGELTDALPSDSSENLALGGGAVAEEAPAEDLYASHADGYAAADEGGYTGDEGYAAADEGYAATDEGYAAADEGYAAADEGGYAAADEGYAAADEGYAAADEGGYAAEAAVEEAPTGFTVEEEPAAAAEEPPERRPTTRMAPPAAAEEEEDRPNRPGQIARNALDDIFARAAKLKKKGSD